MTQKFDERCSRKNEERLFGLPTLTRQPRWNWIGRHKLEETISRDLHYLALVGVHNIHGSAKNASFD